MTLAVHIKDRGGPNNKMFHDLQLKNIGYALLAVTIAKKASYAVYIANKMEYGL